jgi:hypothetical protein
MHAKIRNSALTVLGLLLSQIFTGGEVAHATPPECGTGTVWRVNDTSGEWKSIWVQQPGTDSTIYSGRWQKANEATVTGTLVVSASGNSVIIRRTDDPNLSRLINCSYDGAFGADGKSASGTATCNSNEGKLGPFDWDAWISCEDPRQRFESNVDRPGGDYRNFDLELADPTQCWAQCELEDQCKAWTYVNPNTQGPKARCWLKNSVPAQVPNATFATSGVK